MSEPDAHRLRARWADHLHVRDVQGRLDVYDRRGFGRRALAAVPLREVQTRHDYALLLHEHTTHLRALAAVLARVDLHGVVPLHLRCHYRTSGASEMMRMNSRSRSSRATGPKMRVPRGLPCLSASSTAAFSSNLIEEPSA